MERLTYKAQSNCGYIWALHTPRHSLQNAIDRLAAYENTGLEPEEIEVQSIAVAQCKPYMDALCDEQGKISINPNRLRELAQAEKDGRLIILPESHKKAIRRTENGCDSDFTAEEINNLLFAWDEGRVVVLPCKVGDTVFAAETGPVIPLSVAHVGVWLDGADGGDWEALENFGKTVFLTREEAEAALLAQKGDTQ